MVLGGQQVWSEAVLDKQLGALNLRLDQLLEQGCELFLVLFIVKVGLEVVLVVVAPSVVSSGLDQDLLAASHIVPRFADGLFLICDAVSSKRGHVDVTEMVERRPALAVDFCHINILLAEQELKVLSRVFIERHAQLGDKRPALVIDQAGIDALLRQKEVNNPEMTLEHRNDRGR